MVSSSLFSQVRAVLLGAGLVSVPPGAVFARYCQLSSGSWAVVSSSGVVLGASFFALRGRFSFGGQVFGVGGWVVLVPVAPPAPAVSQLSLF